MPDETTGVWGVSADVWLDVEAPDPPLKKGDCIVQQMKVVGKTFKVSWDVEVADRPSKVRWSGNGWRTEQDFLLLPRGSEVENKAERLSAGDIIYFPPVKIGVAYGPAQWLNPFMEPVDVSLVGKIDRKLLALEAEEIHGNAAGG